MNTRLQIFLCLVSILLTQTSCATSTIEEEFFKGEISTRLDRLENYPLEQQYRIFLYGNQVIHPPTTGLAIPIAKRGKVAVDYILNQLAISRNEPDYRDSLVVFQFTQWRGHFDICGHPDYLNKIKENASKVKNEGWKKIYLKMLNDLCGVT